MNSNLARRLLNKEQSVRTDSDFHKIPYELLIQHPNNTYDIRDIEELADNILAFGLMDPIIVKPAEDGRYLIIGGHRRHAAIKHIVDERGLAQFKDVLCHICDAKESLTIERLRLHSTNFTAREMTEYDKLVQITDLMEIIQKAKDDGEYGFQGKMRDIIANYIHLTEKQIQKYITISKYATDEIKQRLKDRTIAFEDAYEESKKTNRIHGDNKAHGLIGFSTQKTKERRNIYRQIEDDLANVFGTKVTVHGEKRGSISISFNSQDDLDRLFLTLRNVSSYYSSSPENRTDGELII